MAGRVTFAGIAVSAGALVGAFAAGWLVRDVTAPVAEPPAAGPAAAPLAAPVVQGRAGTESADAHRTARDAAVPRRPAAGPRTTAPGDAAPPREPTDGRREGRADPPSFHTVADFQQAIAAAWDEAHPEGPRPDEDDFVRAAQQARDRTDRDLAEAAQAATARVEEQIEILGEVVALRTARGVAAPGPVVVELRARGRQSVSADDLPGVLSADGFDPFDPAQRAPQGQGVTGPLPPAGHSLVIERFEVEARVGLGPGDDGTVSVYWPGRGWVVSGSGRRVRAVFDGALLADVSQWRLDTDDSAARVRLSGRVVPAGTHVESVPFAWRADASEGFLRDGAAVRVQIAADHGGGNPREVDLSGVAGMYFRAISAQPVWDDAADLRRLRQSVCWTENAGLVPPGFVYRVQRIDWRVRLLGGDSHSTFDVAARGEKAPLAEAAPPKEARDGEAVFLSGAWTGDLTIRPGEEDRFRFTCHRYGMADVTVTGRLEPAPR